MADAVGRGGRPLGKPPLRATIGYITAREEPHLEWLIEGLARQTSRGDRIELIVVDALGRSEAELGYRAIPAIKRMVVTPPKPSIWQGPHRITAHDFFANANARNTIIVLATTEYLCFLDDRCKLDAGWIEQVRRGELKRKSVLCGTYSKQEDWGRSEDHRRRRAPEGRKGCSGGWCYGANIALPLFMALNVNGFEEGCDPVGLEDCAFGHMLENAGYRIDFVVGMSVLQDRRGFAHPRSFPRQDKGQSPNDKSHALQERFYGRKRTEFTPDLKKLREQYARDRSFPLPNRDARDWYDGEPIAGACLSEEEQLSRARGSGEGIISGGVRP